MLLFSKAAPAAALLVTMTQRMVELFRRRAAMISAAQKTLLCDMSQGGARARFKSGVRISSILLSWSMEDGLDTADSMKARGYGAARRTSFSIYRFRPSDAAALVVIALCFAVSAVGYYARARFRFYPSIALPAPSLWGNISLAAFVLLASLPILAELTEALKWRY
jgi:energy-coupling factor transport system permease protein